MYRREREREREERRGLDGDHWKAPAQTIDAETPEGTKRLWMKVLPTFLLDYTMLLLLVSSTFLSPAPALGCHPFSLPSSPPHTGNQKRRGSVCSSNRKERVPSPHSRPPQTPRVSAAPVPQLSCGRSPPPHLFFAAETHTPRQWLACAPNHTLPVPSSSILPYKIRRPPPSFPPFPRVLLYVAVSYQSLRPQRSSVTGSSTRDLKALSHCAPTAPSITRWSQLSVTVTQGATS
jgi:hypothetical protein